MQETEPINPYAAPKAQWVNPDTPGVGASRRPASVKWATFLFGLITLVMVGNYGRSISANGVQKVWQEQPSFDLRFLILIGLGLSLFGGRRRIAYYFNAGILAMIAAKLPWNLYFYKWAAKGAFAKMFLLDRCFEALMCCLLGFLFYRFTFGLPSRRYFGLTSGR